MKKLFFILLASIFFTSCGHKEGAHNHDHHGHHHDHEHNAKLHLTGYNDIFEVYAEADPFVTGQESTILTHITWLNNFKPLSRQY